MPTLALALEHPDHLWANHKQERQQMKLMLGGVILTIAILQVADWMQETPALGYPALIILLTAWISEMVKDMRGARR